jgi:hypothetical protein
VDSEQKPRNPFEQNGIPEEDNDEETAKRYRPFEDEVVHTTMTVAMEGDLELGNVFDKKPHIDHEQGLMALKRLKDEGLI